MWQRGLWAASALGLIIGACSGDADEGATGTAGSGASGAGGGGAEEACAAGLESITLDPADSLVSLNGLTAPSITFTATGILGSGEEIGLDVRDLVWEVTREDDTDPGSIYEGALLPNPAAGGVVTVRATAEPCGATGDTTVTFHLDVTVGEPIDPVGWMGTPQTGSSAPEIVYPSDRTRFPRNLYRTLFQWRSDYPEYRVTFTGPYATVTVYTDGQHGLCADANPVAGCWEVDELTWGYIAGSNAGEAATWTVDALDPSTDPPTIWRSADIEIGFSSQDVEGAIFYWSTTSAGVRRGRISQPDPEDYIVGKPVGTAYGNDEVGCVACHTVSRDGLYMAAPVKSDDTDSLWIMDVTADAPPNPIVTDVTDTGGHGFATFSPDNANVVVSFKQDVMWMVDRATGAHVMDLPTTDFGGGTHPDWSPDGTQLVFATGEGDAPGDSSLALVPWNGSAWENPLILLDPPSGSSNLFPMFSPDGAHIAFAQGNGGHGDRTAQLWVVDSAGTEPVELVNLNRMTSNTTTDGQYQNSQPTWAPPGDLDWIAFNTKREYGVVLEEGTQQIWVAAIDLANTAPGEDPSYPAFRVPFQGLQENNHRAFWTLDVGDGGGGSGGGEPDPCTEILQIGEACDPLNDCCETNSYCDTLDNGETHECIDATPQ